MPGRATFRSANRKAARSLASTSGRAANARLRTFRSPVKFGPCGSVVHYKLGSR